ncbi:MAG: hypothetical protein OXT67_13670 [Zetaproteobacteria bacterium]|nr:hypothetical protein [Zetaproteobacteria bacterium]
MYLYLNVKRLLLWGVWMWGLSVPSLLVATSKGKKRKLCDYLNCEHLVVSKGLCFTHGGGRTCEVEACAKRAHGEGRCRAHGGTKRCVFADCTRKAYATGRCYAHGGGKRCALDACYKLAVVTDFCKAHGGGKRCKFEGCGKLALSAGACASHGGGKRCEVEDCSKIAQSRGRCKAHGGGKRCQVEGCPKSAQSRRGLCRRHERSQACWQQPEQDRQDAVAEDQAEHEYIYPLLEFALGVSPTGQGERLPDPEELDLNSFLALPPALSVRGRLELPREDLLQVVDEGAALLDGAAPDGEALCNGNALWDLGDVDLSEVGILPPLGEA